MREVSRISPSEVLPSRRDVLVRTGIVREAEAAPAVLRLVEQALALLRRSVRPVAIREEIAAGEFGRVFEGEGLNGSPSPIETIRLKAERLCLYAATLGRDVQEEIGGRFEAGEFPLGYMLDAAASAAAEILSRVVSGRFLGALVGSGAVPPDRAALDYSPGYCGWHLTGQRVLFSRLVPEEIGIRLSESCLMDPLKSVSGAILVGPATIHRLDKSYPCCSTCSDRECRERAIAPVTLRLS